MKTIHKYQIPVTDDFEIQLPQDSEFLDIQFQHGQLCMWVKINPDNETISYKFHCYGTGHPINTDNLQYIATIQLDDGYLVFHYFVERKIWID